jgi:hypothetical protein
MSRVDPAAVSEILAAQHRDERGAFAMAPQAAQGQDDRCRMASMGSRATALLSGSRKLR